MSSINDIKDILDAKLESLLTQKREEVYAAALGAEVVDLTDEPANEGVLDDLKDKREIDKANAGSFDKENKEVKATKRVIKGSKYGSSKQKPDEDNVQEGTISNPSGD